MNESPDFAPPRDLTTRESHLRAGSGNERQSSGGGTVSYGMDDGMLVTFFEEPKYMEYLSKQVGHPIHRMNIMTRIVQPGNRNTMWVHETKGISYEMVIDPESGEYHTVWDIQEQCDNGDVPEPTKYPKAWRAFERKGISADSGLPIEQWAVVTRSYAESLKMQHIHTVEMLAGLTDQAAQTIMGAIKYRDLAKAYLDDRQKTQIVSREQEKAARAEERAEALAKQVENLQQHVFALQARINTGGAPGEVPRMVATDQNAAQVAALGAQQQVKQMTVKQARGKHKIPPKEAAA